MQQQWLPKPGQQRKNPQHTNQADRAAGDGSGFGHGEPRPHVQERRKLAVGIAEINIFAARKRPHRRKFGIGHGAKQRKNAGSNPRQVDKVGRAGGPHHFARNQKNAAADDRARDDRRGLPRTQNPRQRVHSIGVFIVRGAVSLDGVHAGYCTSHRDGIAFPEILNRHFSLSAGKKVVLNYGCSARSITCASK